MNTKRFVFKISHLFAMLLFLLALDIIILGVWTGIDTLSATEVADADNVLEYWILCRSDNDTTYVSQTASAIALIKTDSSALL